MPIKKKSSNSSWFKYYGKNSLSTPPKKVLHLDNQLFPNTHTFWNYRLWFMKGPINTVMHVLAAGYSNYIIEALYGTEIASHTLMKYILKTWKICWECKLLSRSGFTSSSMWILHKCAMSKQLQWALQCRQLFAAHKKVDQTEF